MPIASERPDSWMRINQNSFDAASTSQVRIKDAYLGGLIEKQRRNLSHQEEEASEDSDNLEAEIWYFTGKQVTREPVAQNSKAWVQPLHMEPVLQFTRKVKVIQKRHGNITSKYRTHIPLHGSPWQSYERFECEFGYLVNVHEYHSSSSSSSRKKNYDTRI